MSGSSWLWGNCGKQTYTYTIPCSDNPNFFLIPPEFSDGKDEIMVANRMADLEALGYQIKQEWKDPIQLKNEVIMTEAVTYRLSLAGYTFNQDWQELEMEPCPVPAPDKEVLVSQFYNFINGDCTNNIVIYPNPSNGVFMLNIKNYKDALSLEIIREYDMSTILTKQQPFNTEENITLQSPLSGYYIVRVTTRTGIIYNRIFIE